MAGVACVARGGSGDHWCVRRGVSVIPLCTEEGLHFAVRKECGGIGVYVVDASGAPVEFAGDATCVDEARMIAERFASERAAIGGAL